MKYKIIFIMIMVLALGLTSAYAGSERKIGTAGGQELLIPVGSRGTAMGGAVVANAYGLESIYWNPAGLASLDGTEAMFTHLPYIADIDVNFGGVATSIEDFGTLAVSAKVVSIGDIEETTEEQPDGTGTVFSPSLSVIGITYARQLTAAVQFGATANIISENIDEVSANGFAFDFGVVYTPNWRGVSLGVAIKNYGPDMQFEGSGLQTGDEDLGPRRVFFESASFELPGHITLGAAWNFLNQDLHSATFAGNFRSNNHSQDVWTGGAEYNYDDLFFLRAGYNYADQDEFLYGVTFGVGLSFDLSESARLSFDYAWTETETFDDNQYFTFRANF